MRLDFLMLADEAEVTESGKLNVQGGGIGHIVLPQLPASVPRLVCIASLSVEPQDHDVIWEVRLSLRAPSGAAIAEAVGPVDLGVLPREPHEGEVPSLTVIANLGTRTFSEYGPHELQVALNGEVLASRNVAVRPNEPEGDPAS